MENQRLPAARKSRERATPSPVPNPVRRFQAGESIIGGAEHMAHRSGTTGRDVLSGV